MFAWSHFNCHLNKAINKASTSCVNEMSTLVHQMWNANIMYDVYCNWDWN